MAPASKPSQDFVPIQEVRDGIIVLKDGSYRAILLASSINFSLKSADEQQAVIAQFQDFLNSLDFSLEITIQSRRLDIRPYVALLEERFHAQKDDLMKIQTREYIQFIKNFTDNSSIMTKSFFVVIPYSPALTGKSATNILAKLFGGGSKKTKEIALDKQRTFEEHRAQIDQRVSIVSQGLSRTGVRLVQLGTEEAVEIFYKAFNPGDTEKPLMPETQ